MMNNEKYLHAFQNLNEMQKQAVVMTDGPVMVIAGPGTGKTQLLSTRVGHILEDADYRPSNILCLTFSNSGVHAIKKRIIELIGPEGDEVEVSTFHSFAEKVIKRASIFEPRKEEKFMDDLDKRLIIRDLLNHVEFNTPLMRGINSVESTIDFLSSYFNYIKQEKLDVYELIKEYKEELNSKKESEEFVYKRASGKNKKGDFNQSKWDIFEHKCMKNLQAAEIYIQYQEYIQREKFLDYQDMILRAIEILQNNEDIRADFQEQYQYIMVDEFQDTNGSQLEIVNCLCIDNDFPNLMVVGDEDQAIFRFQGANIYNIEYFLKRYIEVLDIEQQKKRVIVLDTNYRSIPKVLEASSILINNNEERITNFIQSFQLEKKLFPCKKKKSELNKTIELIYVSNKGEENYPIIRKILDKKREFEAVNVGKIFQYSDFGVLFTTNDAALSFSKFLAIQNIPFELSKQEDLLSDSNILQLIELMKIANKLQQSKSLSMDEVSELLLMPWFRLSFYEIQSFWAGYKEYVGNLDFKEKPIFKYIFENNHFDLVQSIFTNFNALLSSTFKLPPHRFFQHILDIFRIREWALDQTNRLDIIQKIDAFGLFLEDQVQNEKGKKLHEMIKLIEAYIEEKIPIPFEKKMKTENSVQLMTYHKSKGLEFKYVFVHGAGRLTKSGGAGIYIPESMDLLDKEKEKNSAMEEKRRLLFVAMTRAENELYLVDYFKMNNDDKNSNKFIPELPIVDLKDGLKSDSKNIIESYHYTVSPEEFLTYQAVNETVLSLKQEKIFENNFINQRIANFKWSHSSISSYLECPYSFFIEKIINIPKESSYQMTLGNFYHKLFERFFTISKENQKLLSYNEFKSLSDSILPEYQYQLSDLEFDNIVKLNESNLPLMYDLHLSHTTNFEYKIEDELKLNIENVELKGYVDKWDIENNSEIVIHDFKSGRHDKAKQKGSLEPNYIMTPEDIASEMQPTNSQKYGGNYWRQAVIYKLMLQQNFPHLQVKDVRYTFIQPYKNEVITQNFEINADNEEFMKSVILEVDKKMKNREFPHCQDPECGWCTKLDYRQKNGN